MQKRRASKADPQEEEFFLEGVELPGTPGEFPPDRVRQILEIALRQSMANKKGQTATARFVELAGRTDGTWGGRGTPNGRKEPAADAERSIGPAELMGLPAPRAGR